MSKKPKDPRADYYLAVRRYPSGRWATVWLVKRNGSAHAWLMWGNTVPEAVEEIIQVLGLPVEDQGVMPYQPESPIPVPGCTPVEQQRSLFPEAK